MTETPRLALRPLATADLENIYELFRTASWRVMENFGIVWEYELEFEGLLCVKYSMKAEHHMGCDGV